MIRVIARKGVKVPLEDNSRRYITDKEPVNIPAHSPYYIRRMRDKDLELWVEASADAASQAAQEAGITQQDTEVQHSATTSEES